MDKGHISFETQFVRNDRGLVSVEISANTVMIDEKPLIQAFVRDISDLKKDESSSKKFNETNGR